jgi:hypothetical protein
MVQDRKTKASALQSASTPIVGAMTARPTSDQSRAIASNRAAIEIGEARRRRDAEADQLGAVDECPTICADDTHRPRREDLRDGVKNLKI